jgi:hypothetical protein
LRGNRGKQAQTEGCEKGKAHELIVARESRGGLAGCVGGWLLVAGCW